nr:DUF418 domain-containing protein [Bacillus ectoiniformans]
MAPNDQQQRILSIDSLRGLSLLGIFLVNMMAFHSPYLYYNPYEWWDRPSDVMNFQWIDLFVQASFYPLFAMLFGFGAAMQHEKANKRGVSYWPIGLKRFSFLLLIGLIHAFLIWSGDILINYAVFGFLLLILLRYSGKILIITGSVLLFLPNLFLGLLLLLMAKTDPTSVIFWTDITSISQSISAYGSGSFMEITAQRTRDWLTVNGLETVLLQFISIFPHLLIGAGVYKLGVISKWMDKPASALRVFGSFFTAGVILKALPIIFEPNLAYTFIQDSLGGPLLAISYAALVIFLSTKKPAEKLLHPLAAAGRMSLTNYLMQSVIGTLIFYHYGLGLYGQISLKTGVWLVLAIFSIQVLFSKIWLSKFSQGPMESLWRKVTYGGQRKG